MLRRLGLAVGVLLCVSRCTSQSAAPAPVCSAPSALDAPLVPSQPGLRFSELLSANEGVNVDELGETEDWLELRNDGEQTVSLRNYALSDAHGKLHALPDLELAPGQVQLLWADDDQAQGPAHIALKLSAQGERLTLWAGCTPIDRVELPALPDNESYARPAGGDTFALCRYATPGRGNGASCAPPAPPALPAERTYKSFAWPAAWPEAASPLSISELALRPASFVEVLNTSDQTVELSRYSLQLSATRPDAPYPSLDSPVRLVWPLGSLPPGQRVVVELSSTETAALEASPAFEGAALLTGPDGALLDRIEFSEWPAGAVLARMPDGNGQPRLCREPSQGTPNQCAPLATRTIGSRLHALHSESDFGALADGGTESGSLAVKFVVDMEAHDAVHLLGTERWALHYTFWRELINLEPALDRCDPEQAARFDAGWYAFSQREYFTTLGRRFLLGTLVRYGNGLQTVEFTPGDSIDAPLMQRAFLAVIARTQDPRAWSLRPSDSPQAQSMSVLDGKLPIVDRDAPFRDLTFQPLTRAEGFGFLRFVPGVELASTALGPDTIVVTDDVPNDVPLVAGLITEAFQAPLAHVNVLSEARGTPNMALRDARTNPRIAPLLGMLVRLEVGTQDFSLRVASSEEADAFWQSRRPAGPRVVPPSDLRERGLLSLTERSLADLPSIGAKAAQFAELYRVTNDEARCKGPVSFVVPPRAFAIPLVHYDEHFTASGARALLASLLKDPRFRADPAVRAGGLALMRDAILSQPVEPALLAALNAQLAERFLGQRVRFRSSSNTEDLPTFNGAGLHTSVSAQPGDPERTVEDGLRTVWSSLWNLRAYDERENANLEQTEARMGVLVHEQFAGEAAQGVAISRNLLDVTRDDSFYINTQLGEANVTNPAPGVVSEELLYSLPPSWYGIRYQSLSSLSQGEKILSAPEIRALGCGLDMIHRHYRPLLDPSGQNRLFAMQIEFKLDRSRKLTVKQARPQPFGHLSLPTDCR